MMSAVYITILLAILVGLSWQENRFSLPPSRCIFPGSNLTFKCSIEGPGATVWRASFINNCFGSGDITLNHVAGFNQSQACNGGAIIAQALGADNANYTSQLIINLMMISLSNGSMITCAHYINNNEKDVNTWIMIDTPMNLHLEGASKAHLKFSWDPFLLTHPPFRYDIHATNCGSCLESVDSATVVCENLQISTNIQLCSIAVQLRCNEIAGTMSDILQIVLKVPEAPLLQITSHKHRDNTRVNVTIKEIMPFSVPKSSGPDNYTIIYTDADSDMNCNSTVIPAFHCEHGVCKHMLEVSNNSACSSDANIVVTAFATNMFGESPHTIVFVDSVSRVLSSASDFFIKSKVICEFPNDPTNNGPTLFASNSIHGISCENQLKLDINEEIKLDIGDPIMNVEDLMNNDEGYGSCFIAFTKNDTLTIINEGRLSTSITGISDELIILLITIIVFAMLIAVSVGLVVTVIRCCSPSLKSIEVLVEDKPGSLIEPLQVFERKDINISCVDTLLPKQQDDTNKNLKGFRIVYECPKVFNVESLINELKLCADRVEPIPDYSDEFLESPITLQFTVKHVKGALLQALRVLHKYGININDLDTMNRDKPPIKTRTFIIEGDFFKYTREQLRVRLRNSGVEDASFLTRVPLKSMDHTKYAIVKHQIKNSVGSFHNFLQDLLSILMKDDTLTDFSSVETTYEVPFIDLAPGDTNKQHQVCIVCAYSYNPQIEREHSTQSDEGTPDNDTQNETVCSEEEPIKKKLIEKFGKEVVFRPLTSEEISTGETMISVGPDPEKVVGQDEPTA